MQDEVLTTDAAAELLGVTPRRVCQLAAAGELDGVRDGDRLLVSLASVEARSTQGASTGRPWSPATTWAVVWLADGREPDWVHERTLRRLRHVALSTSRPELASRVGRLVSVGGWAAPPRVVSAVLAEPGVVVEGPARRPTVWLPQARTAGLVARHGLVPGVDFGLVGVRGLWPFGPDEHQLPAVLSGFAADRRG